jgi:hypothetical protein
MRTSSIESLKKDALQGHRLKRSRGKADKLVPQSMQTSSFAGNTLVQMAQWSASKPRSAV